MQVHVTKWKTWTEKARQFVSLSEMTKSLSSIVHEMSLSCYVHMSLVRVKERKEVNHQLVERSSKRSARVVLLLQET